MTINDHIRSAFEMRNDEDLTFTMLKNYSKFIPGSPYPDGNRNILACPRCGSGEYLHNEDGNRMKYCGQCGQAICWCDCTD